MKAVFSCALSWCVLGSVALAGSDIVIHDFEGVDYGDWKVIGTAFGTSPAHGALPNQLPVFGYLGNGFVCTFHGVDNATGALTSPSFTIERTYVNFLIGGGASNDACIQLLVDGQIVPAIGVRGVPGAEPVRKACRDASRGFPEVAARDGSPAFARVVRDHDGESLVPGAGPQRGLAQARVSDHGATLCRL